MFSPRLPLAFCEEVIDHCAPPQWDAFTTAYRWNVYVALSAKTLIASALTCRAWLRRSVFHYYSTCLILEDTKGVDRLADWHRFQASGSGCLRSHAVDPPWCGWFRG
ncbi:hypothetical protein FKP32DRAFT_1588603 [Trametes sanguinea]|nr:hypothetical protein FKP32DRAFT_1588603 [Trametes sanguinea]